MDEYVASEYDLCEENFSIIDALVRHFVFEHGQDKSFVQAEG